MYEQLKTAMVGVRLDKSMATVLFIVGCIIIYIALSQLTGRLHVQLLPRTCRPFLCLFTTFRPGDYKIPVSFSTVLLINKGPRTGFVER